MPFKVYRRDDRGGVYYYSGTVNGERVRKSAETTDRALAEDIAAKHEWQLRRAAVHGPEAVLTFGDAVALYVEAGKSGKHIRPLFDRWEKTAVKTITPGEVKKAARELYPKAKPATWNRQVLTPARAVVNHCAELGLCHPIRIKRFKEAKPIRKAVDRDYIDRFMDHAPPRLGCLLLFMHQTAARISEAVSLTWNDIDLPAGTATFGKTKNGDPHVAYLTVEMVAMLANLPKDKHKVFGYGSRQSVYEVTKKTCKKAGIPYLGTHQPGRHSFATQMIIGHGLDAKTVADVGNWKSVRVLLENYVHTSDPRGIVNEVFGTRLSPGERKSPRKVGS